jgi:hypothetical protein
LLGSVIVLSCVCFSVFSFPVPSSLHGTKKLNLVRITRHNIRNTCAVSAQSVRICGEMRATNPLSQETKINLKCTYLRLSSYRAVNALRLGNKTNQLTLILLTWSIWWANNASKWQMGFNLAFKGSIHTLSSNRI